MLKALKFAYFVELTKGYQPAKFQCCRLSGLSFTEELQKYSDVISYFWDSKFLHSMKLTVSYQPAKFPTPQLFQSNFTKVGIRYPQTIMTSLSHHCTKFGF